MRTRIIRDTADIYRPDLFIVDKEPLGLRGEVEPTLRMLKERGTPIVMGLRDVMDDPEQLAKEWERKHIVPALRDLYDEIWIYGLPQINKPLQGIVVPPSVRHKMVYTGYLRRELPLHTDAPHEGDEIDGPFILVTPGGGGDGPDLVDWVLSAYESDPNIPYGAVIVFGPFMSAAARESFKERAARFPNIRTLTFTNNLGALMTQAAGVVAMGGYNTFCEILSFDKKALIVPRTRPRQEQLIRSSARPATSSCRACSTACPTSSSSWRAPSRAPIAAPRRSIRPISIRPTWRRRRRPLPSSPLSSSPRRHGPDLKDIGVSWLSQKTRASPSW
jgi:predicted glycosyltransferase